LGAYSLDLRKRIVDAVERGEHTKREIAEMFNVHEFFIYKLLRQQRDRGDIAPLPHGGWAVSKLDADHPTVLSNLVSGMPDATLVEFREQLKKKARVGASITTIWRALRNLGFSRKKSRSGQLKLIRSSEPNSKRGRNCSP
jgi:transposase